MGYALLNFTTSHTVGEVMYDIVAVATGVTTTIAGLTYASNTNSEIVNTLGENWTRLYGDHSSSTGAYVLTSPCTSNTKTHHVQLSGYGAAGAWNDPTGTCLPTATRGVNLTTISAATSATSVSDQTFYVAAGGGTDIRNSVIGVTASNLNILVSWSRKHIIIYGIGGTLGAATIFKGSFEYPENSLTQFTNTAPVANYSLTYGLVTQALTSTTTTSNYNGFIFQGIKIHVPTDSNTYGVFNLIGDNNYIGVATSGFGTIGLIPNNVNPEFTLSATGANTYQLVPMYYALPRAGIPIINISTLSKVFFMSKNAGNTGDVFTEGSDSYAWHPFGTALSGGTQTGGFAFLKA